FHANVYVFRRGEHVRALVGSARLTGDGLGVGVEAVVRFEGTQDDPFAWSLSDFLESCLARARVPRPGELDEHGAPVTGSSQPGRRAPVRHAEPVSDTGVGKLRLVDDAGTVEELWQQFWAVLRLGAEPSVIRIGRRRATRFWHAGLGLWAARVKSRSR